MSITEPDDGMLLRIFTTASKGWSRQREAIPKDTAEPATEYFSMSALSAVRHDKFRKIIDHAIKND